MTSDLFGIWLKELNRKMAKEKRSILLTVDNASCHNSGIELELSNVKVQFLPKNTTSIMQPLDMGIIVATKVLGMYLAFYQTIFFAGKSNFNHLSPFYLMRDS